MLEQFFPPPNVTFLTQKHYFVLTDVCSLGLEDSFPGSKPGPARLAPQWEAGPPSELPTGCSSSPVPAHQCRVLFAEEESVCQGQWVEWKYLYLQEQWEWGKKINKGKSSRATEVKQGQRRVAKGKLVGQGQTDGGST